MVRNLGLGSWTSSLNLPTSKKTRSNQKDAIDQRNQIGVIGGVVASEPRCGRHRGGQVNAG